MQCFIVISIILAAIGFANAQSETAPSHGKSILCPVNTKSAYEGEFDIDKFDFTLCTHVICIDEYWYVQQDPWNVTSHPDYKQITDLRKKFPHLKILLGVFRNINDYVYAATNGYLRQKFISNATNFVAKHNFDGLELTWAYATGGIFEPFAKNFVLLIKELKEKLQDRLLISTYSVGSVINEYRFHELADHYDLIAILHYFKSADSVENAFESRNTSYIEGHIDTLLKSDVPSSKLLLRLPFDSPAIIRNNDHSKYNRSVNYNTVCELLLNENGTKWTKYFNVTVGLAVASNENAKEGEENTIVFECSRSVANKLRFALKRRLGGVITGFLDADDILGKCGFESDTWEDFKNTKKVTFHIPKRNITQFPLIRTINEAVEVVLDEIRQDPSISTRNTVCLMLLIGSLLAFMIV